MTRKKDTNNWTGVHRIYPYETLYNQNLRGLKGRVIHLPLNSDRKRLYEAIIRDLEKGYPIDLSKQGFEVNGYAPGNLV